VHGADHRAREDGVGGEDRVAVVVPRHDVDGLRHALPKYSSVITLTFLSDKLTFLSDKLTFLSLGPGVSQSESTFDPWIASRADAVHWSREVVKLE
jgi:hypothetical protein